MAPDIISVIIREYNTISSGKPNSLEDMWFMARAYQDSPEGQQASKKARDGQCKHIVSLGQYGTSGSAHLLRALVAPAEYSKSIDRLMRMRFFSASWTANTFKMLTLGGNRGVSLFIISNGIISADISSLCFKFWKHVADEVYTMYHAILGDRVETPEVTRARLYGGDRDPKEELGPWEFWDAQIKSKSKLTRCWSGFNLPVGGKSAEEWGPEEAFKRLKKAAETIDNPLIKGQYLIGQRVRSFTNELINTIDERFSFACTNKIKQNKSSLCQETCLPC